MCGVTGLIPAFRYLTGQKANICRLCLDAVEDTGVSLDESRLVECFYYDDSVSFADMLTELRVHNDPALPQQLCECCADLTMKAFFFLKLFQYTDNKWHEAVEKLNQAMTLTDNVSPNAKYTCIVIQEDSNRLVTGWQRSIKKTKGSEGMITTFVKRHRSKPNVEPKSIYIVCEQCGENVNRKYLSYHVNTKHNDEHKYPCIICAKIFRDKTNLRAHERRHMPKTTPCPLCKRLFRSSAAVSVHINKHHAAVTCKRCFKEFPSKDALRVHSRQHELFQCSKCSKIFDSKPKLKQHCNRCQEAPQTFSCDICKKDFGVKNSLRNHLAAKHGFGTICSCDWCDKKFKHLSSLKQHIVKHTRERNFNCDLCGGVFVTKAALIYHSRLHTGEKPYTCDICQERFLSASRRMDHMRQRHLAPKHICSICGSRFKTKFCLQKHFARHENPQSRLYVSKLSEL